MSEIYYCTKCFKSLGVPSRMEIYRFLAENKSATVSEIVDFVNLTQPTVSYHLHEMKENGMLTSRKKGKEVYYSINKNCPHFHKDCILHHLSFFEEEEEVYER